MLPWHCLALSSLRSKQGPREKARKGQPCLDYNHCVCVSLMRRVGPGVNRRFARHCVANATLSIVRQTQCLGQPERLLTAQGPTSGQPVQVPDLYLLSPCEKEINVRHRELVPAVHREKCIKGKGGWPLLLRHNGSVKGVAILVSIIEGKCCLSVRFTVPVSFFLVIFPDYR